MPIEVLTHMVQSFATSLGAAPPVSAPALPATARTRAPQTVRFSAALDGAVARPAPGAGTEAVRRPRQDAATRGKDLPRPGEAGAASRQPQPSTEQRGDGLEATKSPQPGRGPVSAAASRRPATDVAPNGTRPAARDRADASPPPDGPAAARSAVGPSSADAAAEQERDPARDDVESADVAPLDAFLPDVPLIFVAPPVPVPATDSAAAEGALPAETAAPEALTAPGSATAANAGSGARAAAAPADASAELPVPPLAVSAPGAAIATDPQADAAAVNRLVAANPAAGRVFAEVPAAVSPAPGPAAAGPIQVAAAAAQADPVPPLLPVTAPVAVAAQATFSAAVLGVAQPASRAFAGAIAAASASQRRAASIGEDGASSVVTPLAASAATVLPLAEKTAAPLDLRRHDLAQGLADRIEALRDAVDATSTRIRLVPDALGKIDIAVRRDGATLHVHFAADAAATRAALAEAQPRLADIAAERGLALGETTVGAGGGERGRERSPNAPPAPARGFAPTRHSADQSVSDQRLA